jgi:hypothetical protein
VVNNNAEPKEKEVTKKKKEKKAEGRTIDDRWRAGE